jgi:hyperosmotically inducible periplasmic protein
VTVQTYTAARLPMLYCAPGIGAMEEPMMKLTMASAALAAACMLAGTAVYAQDVDADRSQPKAFVKDSVITTKIKSKLAADHITSLGRIRVDTDADGVVYLSGSAHSNDAVERAVQIARDTDGVRGVHSSLVVKADD